MNNEQLRRAISDVAVIRKQVTILKLLKQDLQKCHLHTTENLSSKNQDDALQSLGRALSRLEDVDGWLKRAIKELYRDMPELVFVTPPTVESKIDELCTKFGLNDTQKQALNFLAGATKFQKAQSELSEFLNPTKL